MDRHKLATAIDDASTDLVKLANEGQDELLAAIKAQADEAEAQGREGAKITLSYSIVLDLKEQKQTNTLSWSVRRKLTAESSLNKEQTELEFPEEGGQD